MWGSIEARLLGAASHAAGCLPGFAARKGIDDFDSALGLLGAGVRDYWAGHSFEDRYKAERIKLGSDDTAPETGA